MTIVPIRLRSDLMVGIANLPHDLTSDEADKIIRVVKSTIGLYAVDSVGEKNITLTKENEILANKNRRLMKLLKHKTIQKIRTNKQ